MQLKFPVNLEVRASEHKSSFLQTQIVSTERGSYIVHNCTGNACLHFKPHFVL
jgi:hypothetical protein